MLTIRRNGREREQERESEGEREEGEYVVYAVSNNCTKHAIGTGGWSCRYVTVSCDSSVAGTESCEALLSLHRSWWKMPLQTR